MTLKDKLKKLFHRPSHQKPKESADASSIKAPGALGGALDGHQMDDLALRFSGVLLSEEQIQMRDQVVANRLSSREPLRLVPLPSRPPPVASRHYIDAGNRVPDEACSAGHDDPNFLSDFSFAWLIRMLPNKRLPDACPDASDVQSRKRALLVINALPVNLFDLSTVDSYGSNCLHLFITESRWIIDDRAVGHKHLLAAYFERVVRHGQSPDAARIQMDSRNSFGETPLYMAVQRNLTAVVASLLSNGVNVAVLCLSQEGYLQSPLHGAVRMRNAEIVEFLLLKAFTLDGTGDRSRALCELKDGRDRDAITLAWQLHVPPVDDMTPIIELLSSYSFPIDRIEFI